ncbi:MAG: glycosyltransferase family 2 protein [Micavibrio sp.]
MNQPLITIGLTCFNARDTIIRAINSALAQTWTNKEILVVDDCSSDQSSMIVEDLSQNNPTIRLIQHKTNQGPGSARQTIVENAFGDFIAFFDDDDESLPTRIETQYLKLISYEQESSAKLIACYASGKRIYPNGYMKILPSIGSKPKIPQGESLADFILFNGKIPGLYYGSGTPSCALMARKTTFISVGGFDPAFRRVEDADFAVRLSRAKGHFIGCPDILFIQYATTAIDKTPRKNYEAELMLVEKHRDYLDTKGLYEYARRWPAIRYHYFGRNYAQAILVLLSLFLRYPVRVTRHFFESAPRRFMHELKIMHGEHS